MTEERDKKARRSLVSLFAELPTLIVQLLKDELENLKRELTSRLAKLGIGVGLLVAAGLFAFFALAVLIAAAVLGLATVLPAWLAALIVAGGLLLLVAILALVGIGSIKKGAPPVPEDAITSIKKDINVVKGLGQ
ncbi:phage holin family protein [Herbiconiux sp. KACC 21604]|uniref:phage holin family protein n=1 Tax=unclassified Herbiconiux TaxID=2618217 RepID=UPI001492B578|nr:phage holin family protein [Herbiconiux sp. SALV-R1]QJU55515.1 phage holin family protein [Herbiconiux sp. SALV-R1]WPO86701.1 phage holin family protein [Herbiconiux sp. KACC 21604]